MSEKPTYEELEQRVKRMEALIKNSQIATVQLTQDNIITEINPAFTRLFGFEQKDVVGKYIDPLLALQEYREEAEQLSRQTFEGDTIHKISKRRRKDGILRDVEIFAGPLKVSGKVVGSYGQYKDITERKQAEEELQKLASVVKYSSELINLATLEGKMIFLNKAGREMLGIGPEEVERVHIMEVIPDHLRELVQSELLPALMQGNTWQGELQYRNIKTGDLTDVHAMTFTVQKPNTRKPLFLANVSLDITDRKRTEAALQESEQKYLSLLEANPDPVVVYDMEGKVIYFNPAFTRVFGWSLKERIGKKMDNFVPEENWPETRAMIKKVTESEQRFSDLETCRYTKEGNIIPVSISGSFYEDQEGNMAGSVVNLRDISERKKLEAQFQQTQKMEAIGTLAGGIAHDFNNILSAIMGFTEISLEQVENDTDLYSNLQEVFRAGNRAKGLVKHILTFSRQTEKERKPVQVKLIAKEAIKFFRSSLPTTIDIRADIQSNSLVLGDPTQVHQILMNLCTNAGHAMQKNGGVLDVKLEDVELDVDFTIAHPDMKPGAYINLVVRDTGCGIPSHVLDQIFDPFFTTKKTGEGTGMGLSVVHGIVGSYGGTITVKSEPGQGSTFNVYLPILEMHKEKEIITEEPIATGSECILFIDDEPVLANLGKQILESLGYDVVIRNSSIEALELFKAQPDRFDLVITDMTMPHMTGDDLAGKLIQIKPEIPVILCTGYSAKINEQLAMAMGIRAFVLKPFVKREIATKVREALDES